jgi:starch-binding outer membrane protein, SusD/RagB family
MRSGFIDSHPLGRALLVLLLSATVGGCSPDDLLDVEYPDFITEAAIGTSAGADALRIRAIGDFAQLFNGNMALATTGALWTDELASGRQQYDFFDNRANYRRDWDISFRHWSNLRNQSLRAVEAMTSFLPDGPDKSTKIGHMKALDGLGMVLMAEHYCSGIPIGRIEDGKMVFDETPLTYNQLFELGIQQLDAALAVLPQSATDLRNLALVSKARALLNLDRPSEAAAVVVSVPTSFTWKAEFASGAVQSGLYDWIETSGNYTPTNREGNGNYDSCDGTGQGLPYICEGDPRIRIQRPHFRVGQDGTTRIYRLLDHTKPNYSITVASGIEARLIEAEANLRAGGSTWLTILNGLRATMISGLGPLSDPGTEKARVDLLFKERAYWMYLTAHRAGDMRRLVRQYGRQASDVYPSGAFFKGGTYATQYVFEPHEAEANRPDGAPEFVGCINLQI